MIAGTAGKIAKPGLSARHAARLAAAAMARTHILFTLFVVHHSHHTVRTHHTGSPRMEVRKLAKSVAPSALVWSVEGHTITAAPADLMCVSYASPKTNIVTAISMCLGGTMRGNTNGMSTAIYGRNGSVEIHSAIFEIVTTHSSSAVERRLVDKGAIRCVLPATSKIIPVRRTMRCSNVFGSEVWMLSPGSTYWIELSMGTKDWTAAHSCIFRARGSIFSVIQSSASTDSQRNQISAYCLFHLKKPPSFEMHLSISIVADANAGSAWPVAN
jgi:hypothetical protein